MFLLLLAFLAAPARAELLEDGGRRFAGIAPSFSFDYIGVGTIDRHAKQSAERRCQNLLAGGAAACEYDGEGKGAFGARIGLMYRTAEIMVGPSLGVYYGGPTAGKTSVRTGPADAFESRIRNTTFRFLLEDALRFEFQENHWVHLNGSGGMALVHQNESCSATGTLTPLCPPERKIGHGFWTWELGPSVLIGPVELAFRWVGFARRAYKPWNTFSFSLGFRL
ncbi:MAG: hypothetical protein HY553_02305 [Elusimicrobia bacterium]|nr:hypothetical protein [Elusimicrobiota bacterium]